MPSFSGRDNLLGGELGAMGRLYQGALASPSRVGKSSTFLKFRLIFLTSQTFLIFFLILALRMGSPTREGPSYATALVKCTGWANNLPIQFTCYLPPRKAMCFQQ